MARKFLYLFSALIVLVVAAAFAYRLFGAQLLRMALEPRGAFVAARPLTAADYQPSRMWIARPDMSGNPALWTPAGYKPTPHPVAAVFYIHPTSYLARDHWNAPLDDPEANHRAALFLQGQASAFNAAGDIWAPRYRQATFGTFLTADARTADRALGLAYGDVSAAFDAFLAANPPPRPIILVGHSQGALHLLRLLRERVAGKPLVRRVVAAYAVGWPISRTTDLAALGLPPCARADQARCLLSWQSFAEPTDPALVVDRFDRTTGFDGRPRRGTPMVCTNPLTGTDEASAPPSANRGTLYPARDLDGAGIVAGKVGARCAGRGLLLIGDPPAVGPYVLPGNNYHVYDVSLFWANVRADAERRLKAWGG